MAEQEFESSNSKMQTSVVLLFVVLSGSLVFAAPAGQKIVDLPGYVRITFFTMIYFM